MYININNFDFFYKREFLFKTGIAIAKLVERFTFFRFSQVAYRYQFTQPFESKDPW